MVDKKILANYPLKRLKPVDGLAVTAQIWNEAHEYHRLQQQYHDLLRHGPGIIAGLEVIASDPPDSSVYILPGMALDAKGELIVLVEPVAFDFGLTKGQLYLLLSYAESRPEQDVEGGPLYVHAQFGVETLSTLPGSQYIELARINRSEGSPINLAASFEFPKDNEIDLRFRTETGKLDGNKAVQARIAVCYAGKGKPIASGHGLFSLARGLRNIGWQVHVDDDIPIGPGLEAYTLVYLVAQSAFQFTRNQMNDLYAYVHNGGTILMESCCKELSEGKSPADSVFTDLATTFAIQLAELAEGHPLLVDPNFFPTIPPGFETVGNPSLLVGDGLVVSANDYGCLWQGTRRDRPATREEIRSALEWGENLIHFALNRKQEVSHP